jgi:hypothetical protein
LAFLLFFLHRFLWNLVRRTFSSLTFHLYALAFSSPGSPCCWACAVRHHHGMDGCQWMGWEEEEEDGSFKDPAVLLAWPFSFFGFGSFPPQL